MLDTFYQGKKVHTFLPTFLWDEKDIYYYTKPVFDTPVSTAQLNTSQLVK